LLYPHSAQSKSKESSQRNSQPPTQKDGGTDKVIRDTHIVMQFFVDWIREFFMKKILVLITLTFTTIISLNFINLQSSMYDVIEKDVRNRGVQIYAHYDYFFNPNVINLNFWNIEDDKTMADIDRLLFQFAELLKDKSYEKVIFSFRFNKKFFIEGEYFKKLGEEYSYQNPVYLIRKFPEELYKMNGNKAFGTWTGGLLGVLTKQIEDHKEIHKVWYLEDWAKSK